MDTEKIYLTIQAVYQNKAFKIVTEENISYEKLLKKVIEYFSIDKKDEKYIEISYLDEDNEKNVLDNNDSNIFKYSQEISKNQFLLKLNLELVYYNSVNIDPKELNNLLKDENNLEKEKNLDLNKIKGGINEEINKLRNELSLEKQKSQKYENILKNRQKEYQKEKNNIKNKILKLFDTNYQFPNQINNINDNDKMDKNLLKINKEFDFIILNNSGNICKINNNSNILSIYKELQNLTNVCDTLYRTSINQNKKIENENSISIFNNFNNLIKKIEQSISDISKNIEKINYKLSKLDSNNNIINGINNVNKTDLRIHRTNKMINDIINNDNKSVNESLKMAYEIYESNSFCGKMYLEFNEILETVFYDEKNNVIKKNITNDQKNKLKDIIKVTIKNGGNPWEIFDNVLSKIISKNFEDKNNPGEIIGADDVNDKIEELKVLFFDGKSNMDNIIKNIRNIYDFTENDPTDQKIIKIYEKYNKNLVITCQKLSNKNVVEDDEDDF